MLEAGLKYCFSNAPDKKILFSKIYCMHICDVDSILKGYGCGV